VLNTQDNKLKRKKNVFWLMASDISVHGQFACYFGVFGEATHHDGQCMERD
jgi:hypothetical protein